MYTKVFLLVALYCLPTTVFAQSSESIQPLATIFEPGVLDKAVSEYKRIFSGQEYSFKVGELHELSGCDAPEVGGVCSVKVADENLPYTGSYYPEYQQGFNSRQAGTNQHGSLDKYDQAFGQFGFQSAASWEIANNRRPVSWYGHCNGYGAASSRHKAPEQSVERNGVVFRPGDIKALLAEVYMSNNLLWLGGVRCESSVISNRNQRRDPTRLAPCEDINPATFHLSLMNFIGRQKRPLIFDESAIDQVWNYPIASFATRIEEDNISIATAYQYLRVNADTRSYRYNNDPNVVLRRIKTTIHHTEATAQESDNSTTRLIPKTYDYILELRRVGDDFEIIGGEWIFDSINNHPDFVWISYGPRAPNGSFDVSNPYVDYNEVLKMWSESVGLSNIPEHPYSVSSAEANQWGSFNGWYVAIDNARDGKVFIQQNGNLLDIHRVKEVLTNESLIGNISAKIYLNGEKVSDTNISGTGVLQTYIRPRKGPNHLKVEWSRGGKPVSQGFTNFFGN